MDYLRFVICLKLYFSITPFHQITIPRLDYLQVNLIVTVLLIIGGHHTIIKIVIVIYKYVVNRVSSSSSSSI